MYPKTARWPSLFRSQAFTDLSGEELFSQEDADTRASIRHYLQLAEKLLKRHPAEETSDEEKAA